MQCVGTAIWTIKCNETGYEEKFKMNPGDLLYFPQECTHEIISDTARANLIFNIPPEHLLL
jgi:ribosomal protein L16 Arg81 hydroxylase